MSFHTFHVDPDASISGISSEASSWSSSGKFNAERMKMENSLLQTALNDLIDENQALKDQLEVAKFEKEKAEHEKDKKVATFNILKLTNEKYKDEMVAGLAEMTFELGKENKQLRKVVVGLEGRVEELEGEKLRWVREKIKHKVERWMVAGMEMENTELKKENEELKAEVADWMGLEAAGGGKKKMRMDMKNGEGQSIGEAMGFRVSSS